MVRADPPDSRVIPAVPTGPLVDTAVLGDVEAFAPVLVRTAQAYRFFEAAPSRIPAEGAPWMWGIADRAPPSALKSWSVRHARPLLAEAAPARFPGQPAPAAAWLQAQPQVLFDGPLAPLLAELHHAGLSEFAHYFETHPGPMRYWDFQEAGLPIGSGRVESDVQPCKQRRAGPRMRWSPPRAERRIPIRPAVLDLSFDARWAHAAPLARS